MGWGLYLLCTIPNPANGQPALRWLGAGRWARCRSSAGTRSARSTIQIYVGVVALVANLIIAVVVTLIARQAKWFNGLDATNKADYDADDGNPKLKEIAIH